LEAACEGRHTNEYLTIYAGETQVNVEKLCVKSDHISVVSNPRFIDESLFYGESTLHE